MPSNAENLAILKKAICRDNFIRETWYGDIYRAPFNINGKTKTCDILYIRVPFEREKERAAMERFHITKDKLPEFYNNLLRSVQTELNAARYIRQKVSATNSPLFSTLEQSCGGMCSAAGGTLNDEQKTREIIFLTEPHQTLKDAGIITKDGNILLSDFLKLSIRIYQTMHKLNDIGMHLGAIDFDDIVMTIPEEGQQPFFVLSNLFYSSYPDRDYHAALPSFAPQNAYPSLSRNRPPTWETDIYALSAFIWTMMDGNGWDSKPNFNECPSYLPDDLAQPVWDGFKTQAELAAQLNRSLNKYLTSIKKGKSNNISIPIPNSQGWKTISSADEGGEPDHTQPAAEDEAVVSSEAKEPADAAITEAPASQQQENDAAQHVEEPCPQEQEEPTAVPAEENHPEENTDNNPPEFKSDTAKSEDIAEEAVSEKEAAKDIEDEEQPQAEQTPESSDEDPTQPLAAATEENPEKGTEQILPNNQEAEEEKDDAEQATDCGEDSDEVLGDNAENSTEDNAEPEQDPSLLSPPLSSQQEEKKRPEKTGLFRFLNRKKDNQRDEKPEQQNEEEETIHSEMQEQQNEEEETIHLEMQEAEETDPVNNTNDPDNIQPTTENVSENDQDTTDPSAPDNEEPDKVDEPSESETAIDNQNTPEPSEFISGNESLNKTEEPSESEKISEDQDISESSAPSEPIPPPSPLNNNSEQELKEMVQENKPEEIIQKNIEEKEEREQQKELPFLPYTIREVWKCPKCYTTRNSSFCPDCGMSREEAMQEPTRPVVTLNDMWQRYLSQQSIPEKKESVPTIEKNEPIPVTETHNSEEKQAKKKEESIREEVSQKETFNDNVPKETLNMNLWSGEKKKSAEEAKIPVKKKEGKGEKSPFAFLPEKPAELVIPDIETADKNKRIFTMSDLGFGEDNNEEEFFHFSKINL